MPTRPVRRSVAHGLFFQVLFTVLYRVAKGFYTVARIPEFFGRKTFGLMYWISATFLPTNDDED